MVADTSRLEPQLAPRGRRLARGSSRAAVAFLVAVVGLAGSAEAAINGFQVNKIEGLSGLSLNARLGTTTGSTDHLVNITDCNAYLGGRIKVTVDVQPLLPSTATTTVTKWEYKAAYEHFNGSCATDPPVDDSGKCSIAATGTIDNGTSAQISFEVPLDSILSSCPGTDDTVSLVVWVDGQNTTDDVDQYDTVDIEVDLTRPSAPTNLVIDAGDARLSVDWDAASNAASTDEYNVYWLDSVFDSSDYDSRASSSKGKSSTNYDIDSGLSNGTTYYVAVTSVDKVENESALLGPITAVPVPTTDFWEQYKGLGGPEEGGFCFIATATYGTPMAAELGALRSFRDNVMMQGAFGQELVRFYYRWGRYPAAWIADKPALRAVVRVALVPLVWVAKLFVHLPWGLALALLGIFGMLLVRIRRELLDRFVFADVPREVRRC